MSFKKNNKLDKELLNEFISKIEFKLPKGYLKFMTESNGVEGSINNSYLSIWPIEELFDLNAKHGIDEFVQGFFLIGSNGADIAYVVNKD